MINLDDPVGPEAPDDLERRVESGAVTELLEGAADPVAAAERIDLLALRLRVIAVLTHARTDRAEAARALLERITAGRAWSRPGRSALSGATVHTLLPCGDDPGPALEWARATLRELPEHLRAVAAVGGPADPASLPTSRQEADECLELGLPGAGADPVIYDHDWDAVLLHRLRAVARSGRMPTRNPVLDLVRHDEDHGTDYARTLRAWLYAQGDPKRTAELLGVLTTTVRYRMRRLRGVAELDLDDPADRVAMTVSLAALAEPNRTGPEPIPEWTHGAER